MYLFYILCCNTVLYSWFILLLNCSTSSHWQLFYIGSYVPLTSPILWFLSISLLLHTKTLRDALGSPCILLALAWELAILWSPNLFYWIKVLETRVWVLVALVVTPSLRSLCIGSLVAGHSLKTYLWVSQRFLHGSHSTMVTLVALGTIDNF